MHLPLEVPTGLPIGDDWIDTPTTEPVHFPYDGSEISRAPTGTADLARKAIEAALAVEDEAADLPARLRHELLMRAHATIAAKAAELEQLLVLETGKPLRDCRVEVQRALLTLLLSAQESMRLHGETVPVDLLPSGDGLVAYYQRVPIGVVVGIAGFNYPFLLAMHKVAPAVAAGCPVICKPAPQTPLATLWLAKVLRDAASAVGASPALVQVVTGGVDVGEALTTDPRIGAVSFTGSAAVGHRIARAAAPRKVLLELGSNAALVVAADANLEAAADAAVNGGFYASGQACISVQRLIVEEPVYDDFLKLVADRATEVRVGDPRDEATQVSRLIDETSTTRVREWIGDALEHGASVVAGGAVDALVPTVLRDVDTDHVVWSEEVFGPVVVARSVPDLDTAFDVVNDSRYGLHASVFTASLSTAMTAIRRLKVGGVIVNEVPGFRSDTMPYGGVKDSGIGREGPRYAIEELTVTKMAVIRS
ncbi:aldehyde dehydrogenase family protein [Nocardioides sp. LHG3406-4]|uniref:aldehyde dehydrogenase family protein n=1 Tax=Nocardioides sp. LHG3406-4 TaxID=2804575 RepID=UPI003CE7FAFD